MFLFSCDLWLVLLLILLPISTFIVYFFSFKRLKKWFYLFSTNKFLRKKLSRSRWVLAKRLLSGIIAAAVIFLLLFASTSPVKESREKVPVKQPFLMAFGMDVSLSVLARDCSIIENGQEVKILRLEMMKRAMIKAVRSLEYDKVGLVLFTETAIPVFTKFTTDYENVFIRMLHNIDEGYVASLKAGTNLTPAFLLGLRILVKEEQREQSKEEQREKKEPTKKKDSKIEEKETLKKKKILIILTDAEETEIGLGVISPDLARAIREYSKEENIALYLVGVGDPSRATPIEKGRNERGEIEYYDTPPSKPDMEKLANIAAMTGGKFIHSHTGEELTKAFKRIISQERQISGWEEKVVFKNITGELITVALVLVCALVFLLRE